MPGNAIYAALLGAALILYLLECRADWHCTTALSEQREGARGRSWEIWTGPILVATDEATSVQRDNQRLLIRCCTRVQNNSKMPNARGLERPERKAVDIAVWMAAMPWWTLRPTFLSPSGRLLSTMWSRSHVMWSCQRVCNRFRRFILSSSNK